MPRYKLVESAHVEDQWTLYMRVLFWWLPLATRTGIDTAVEALKIERRVDHERAENKPINPKLHALLRLHGEESADRVWPGTAAHLNKPEGHDPVGGRCTP